MQNQKYTITNIAIFYKMAKEAAEKSLQNLNAHRTPKPNGEPGFILQSGDRTSFREALIAIAFSGIYLEALFKIVTRLARGSGLSLVRSAKKERYGRELKKLGVVDPSLLEEVVHFNEVRNQLLHEDSYEVVAGINHLPKVKDFTAQDEAEKAVKLIRRVTDELQRIYRIEKGLAP